ncbi:nitroreductase family protein [Falsihalocynthiibacter arcticus]|uniref:Putative NAD(P)H nitroreductase n=1 Tax=Falsihalocynthiibacter arcticus TaxID=1579316 RepID=A0A126UVG7_9RHOB|nr:nitroreductase [Falsihalocynthiibacter arcticus]AML50040.1 nitroreductase [Falsihalocynthiibacter arcticus]
MPKPNPAAMEFLLSRRSRPAKTLTFPIPSAQDLHPILTAAARTPDHGKLEPWRFIVLADAALPRLADLTDQRGAALGLDDEKRAKSKTQFSNAGLVVAVVSSPKSSEKVPYLEQVYSAGAVCLALVNAALASGWGANWLTGWMAYDPEILTEGLGLGEGETVAGFIHLGTETSTPPERPRPDLAAITTWVTE